jgi:OFA family oxalate/formate antiporter-like MFS transporter
VLTAPVALRPETPTWAFLPLGIGYLVLSLVGASFFRNPPAGYTVPGWVPSTTGPVRDSYKDYTENEALRTPQWFLLTAILTLNVTVGISLISQASSTAVDIAGYSAAGAATVVGVLALFTGGGRIFWAWISGKTGRMVAFGMMLGLQGICLLLIPHASNAPDKAYTPGYAVIGIIALAALVLPLVTKMPRPNVGAVKIDASGHGVRS